MNTRRFCYLFILACVGFTCGSVNVDVNWSEFLGRHDPVWQWAENNNWTWAPLKWDQGAFIGNGLLGSLVTANSSTYSLVWEVGRTDVWDTRKNGSAESLGNFVYDRPRLPIGKFFLQPAGNVKEVSMALSIYNAELTSVISSQAGVLHVRSYTHASNLATVVEVFGPTDSYEFLFTPELAISAWALDNPPKNYVFNPDPFIESIGDAQVCIQVLIGGGGYATAWKKVSVGISHSVLYFSVGYSSTSIADAIKQSISNIDQSASIALEDFQASHRTWWHNYYPASFVTLPDSKVEGFYWLQMYKLASGTRQDRPALDLMGPWIVGNTGWPDIHWDLNIQLTYWPTYTSNRLSIATSLLNIMDSNIQNLMSNVPGNFLDSAALPVASAPDCLSTCYWIFEPNCLIEPPMMTGNLLWVCHNYWLHYRRTMNNTLLAEGLYPLLNKSVNFYLQFMEIGSDGYIHLPVTFSPEYPISGPDANYDLSLFKWGCLTLLKIVNILNVTNPNIGLWNKVVNQLTPYPVDADGFMIAEGVPLNISHRHYSHLFMIFPLGIFTYDDVQNRPLIDKSVDHWIGFTGGLTGFSLTGAAAMSARIGRPEAAVGNLTDLLDNVVTPNTFYWEGSEFPVIETPLSGADVVHDLLLQSWGEVLLIRVFPSVPQAWSNVSFSSFLAEGGFEISASRVNSTTLFIQITSLAGAPCSVQTDLPQPIVADPPSVPLTVYTPPNSVSNVVIVNVGIKQGQTVVLYYKGTDASSFKISPLVGNSTQYHYWGYHPL